MKQEEDSKKRFYKSTRKWKRSKRSTKTAYLENITTKLDFSHVVIGSDLKAILFSFLRDLPLLIEQDHVTLQEELENDIPDGINSDSVQELKNSLLFVMNLNGKVFSYDSLQIEEKIIKTDYDIFYFNEVSYTKLKDPFGTDDNETLVIDKVLFDVFKSKKKKFFAFPTFEREEKKINKIISKDEAFWCFSYLDDLHLEENRTYSIRFELEDILAEIGWMSFPAESVERHISYHCNNNIPYDNYTDISNLSFNEVLDAEEESHNLKLYGKFGQTLFTD